MFVLLTQGHLIYFHLMVFHIPFTMSICVDVNYDFKGEFYCLNQKLCGLLNLCKVLGRKKGN